MSQIPYQGQVRVIYGSPVIVQPNSPELRHFLREHEFLRELKARGSGDGFYSLAALFFPEMTMGAERSEEKPLCVATDGERLHVARLVHMMPHGHYPDRFVCLDGLAEAETKAMSQRLEASGFPHTELSYDMKFFEQLSIR